MSEQVSGTEMSKWLNELCPIILDMLQDASLIAKREVRRGDLFLHFSYLQLEAKLHVIVC